MFKEERNELKFRWSDLGDIEKGRPNLGNLTTVTAYRLLQYTMRDVLIKNFGPRIAGEIVYEAGKKAGIEFCGNVLDTRLEFNPFISKLQQVLKEHRIGVLRMEEAAPGGTDITLSVYEDLDCSGLPMSDETICSYDEGFIAGIMEAYTGKPYTARETECWATGARACRFKATQDESVGE